MSMQAVTLYIAARIAIEYVDDVLYIKIIGILDYIQVDYKYYIYEDKFKPR